MCPTSVACQDWTCTACAATIDTAWLCKAFVTKALCKEGLAFKDKEERGKDDTLASLAGLRLY